MMSSDTFIFGFLNGRSLSLSFVSERDKTLLSLKKIEKKFFKITYYFFITSILTKIALFFVPESLIIHYLGANPCWYNFGTSSFAGSILQIPGLLLHPLACTLVKQGIAHAVIEVIIAAMIMVGIIALYFQNKYSGQELTIEGNALSLRGIRGIIRTHLAIKRDQNDMKYFVNIENEMLPEVLRISGGSRFCWIDMYGENVYGPIFWEERSEESEKEKGFYCGN
ncbi:MAG: hypothetical protein AB9861_07120 [Methanosarcina sp.]|jgi:hypothetical protein